MLTVIFRLESESVRNTIAIPNEDTLLNVCFVFESTREVNSYTIIDPENMHLAVSTVGQFGWVSDSFPKFKPFQEF